MRRSDRERIFRVPCDTSARSYGRCIRKGFGRATSEHQLQGELNRSRRGPCSRHLTERTASRTGIRAQKLGMVQGVEPIGAELELEPLPVNCSGQHSVQIVL